MINSDPFESKTNQLLDAVNSTVDKYQGVVKFDYVLTGIISPGKVRVTIINGGFKYSCKLNTKSDVRKVLHKFIHDFIEAQLWNS